MNQIGKPDPDRIALQPGVELWVTQMSALARRKMSGQITALVWAYEHGPSRYLAVDMIGKDEGDLSLAFLTGQPTTDYSLDDLETTCFSVVDMGQAVDMAHRLLKEVGLTSDQHAKTLSLIKGNHYEFWTSHYAEL